MIHTSKQLKALVRNMSNGDSTKAQTIIRNYVMERFLERQSLSSYRDNFILKGGTLVSAMAGLDNRSTMDVDASIKNLPLSVESARRIVEGIVSILAYNIETVLAEKIETLLSRGTANTSQNRGSLAVVGDTALILDEIQDSPEMMGLWKNYRNKFGYAADIRWDDVMKSVRKLCDLTR